MDIYCDGGARGNPGPAASAFVAIENKQVVFKQGKFLGHATNNVAEYSAVILALTWLQKQNCKEVNFRLDSQLVAKQMDGSFKIKNAKLQELNATANALIKNLKFKISFSYIPRIKNSLADKLVNDVLDENS
jgi:ribonuclease HI